MKKILLRDQLYGTSSIQSPVIIELIRSAPMQRLKKISQYGLPPEYYHLKSFSRFEHSIGVMLLLRKFGATGEEQIAGLLHDVSHTAFSHLVDWFVGSGDKEDFQDKQHKKFILRSEIATILKKHKYNPKRIVEYYHFTLLEQPLPHLCADRLDYALREFPRKIARACLSDLIVVKGKFVFKTKRKALLFSNQYMKHQREHWGGEEAVTRYTILAKTLEYAMRRKIIAFEDFWTYDEYVLRKLRHSHDVIIHTNLGVLAKRSLSSLPRSKKTLRKKFRFIDPAVLVRNKLYILSKLSPRYARFLEREKKENAKGIPQPVLHY